MKSPLKNIVFDMGNVLITIDYKKTEQAFENLGYNNFSQMYSQFTADALFENLETGKVTTADFYKKMKAVHHGEVSEAEIANAWNSMLLTWRTRSLNFLETLSAKYRIYLLSNTNEIHYNEVIKMLVDQTVRTNIDELFTMAYYSHKIGHRKPDASSFEYVLKDAGILATETLFVDDLENNIATAASLGFKTHLLLPGETIEELNYENF